jgi:SAM-dependent methyltransferase
MENSIGILTREECPDLKGAYYKETIENNLWSNSFRLKMYNDFVFGEVSFAGKSVLDIGGGTGRSSFYAATCGASRVVCLEPNADGSTKGQLDKFGRIADRLNLRNVNLIPATFQDFEGQPGSFDVILLLGAVNHLDEWACIHLREKQEAIERYRVLFSKLATLAASNADLIVTDCSPFNVFPLLGIKNPMAPTIEWHKHQPPELWSKVLGNHGFGSPRIRWAAPHALGKLGWRLLGNRWAAYFLRSSFCLHMKKRDPTLAA